MGVGNRGLGGRLSSPRKASLAVAGALLALIVFPALSGADASNPPTITVGAVTGLTPTTATLNGMVDPNDNANAADYRFTGTFGSDIGSTVGPGSSAVPVSSGPIGGLTPRTT